MTVSVMSNNQVFSRSNYWKVLSAFTPQPDRAGFAGRLVPRARFVKPLSRAYIISTADPEVHLLRNPLRAIGNLQDP